MADEGAEAAPAEPDAAAEQPTEGEAPADAEPTEAQEETQEEAHEEAQEESVTPEGDETAPPGEEGEAPGEEGVPMPEDAEGESFQTSQTKFDEMDLEIRRPSEVQTVELSPSMSVTEAKRRTVRSVSSIEDKKMSLSASRMDRRSKYSSKAKMTLGSVIDIRRGTVSGDTADRKLPRYMNTYKMDSDNPFNPERVDKILQAVLVEAMENLTYDGDRCPKQAKWASMAIRAKVKEMEFDRYKIINLVTIGEKHSQDMYATCRFLWDAERDRYSTYAMENTYVYGIAQCFGIYYE